MKKQRGNASHTNVDVDNLLGRSFRNRFKRKNGSKKKNVKDGLTSKNKSEKNAKGESSNNAAVNNNISKTVVEKSNKNHSKEVVMAEIESRKSVKNNNDNNNNNNNNNNNAYQKCKIAKPPDHKENKHLSTDWATDFVTEIESCDYSKKENNNNSSHKCNNVNPRDDKNNKQDKDGDMTKNKVIKNENSNDANYVYNNENIDEKINWNEIADAIAKERKSRKSSKHRTDKNAYECYNAKHRDDKNPKRVNVGDKSDCDNSSDCTPALVENLTLSTSPSYATGDSVTTVPHTNKGNEKFLRKLVELSNEEMSNERTFHSQSTRKIHNQMRHRERRKKKKKSSTRRNAKNEAAHKVKENISNLSATLKDFFQCGNPGKVVGDIDYDSDQKFIRGCRQPYTNASTVKSWLNDASGSFGSLKTNAKRDNLSDSKSNNLPDKIIPSRLRSVGDRSVQIFAHAVDNSFETARKVIKTLEGYSSEESEYSSDVTPRGRRSNRDFIRRDIIVSDTDDSLEREDSMNDDSSDDESSDLSSIFSSLNSDDGSTTDSLKKAKSTVRHHSRDEGVPIEDLFSDKMKQNGHQVDKYSFPKNVI